MVFQDLFHRAHVREHASIGPAFRLAPPEIASGLENGNHGGRCWILLDQLHRLSWIRPSIRGGDQDAQRNEFLA